MIARPEFPVAQADDDDDVAWALSTAQVQWKRGSQADAVVWLRRAIDSAVSVGATWRAAELTRQTDALEAHLMHGAPAAPVSIPDVDDYDGTEIIDEDAVSLPPDIELNGASSALSGDATDELTDATPDDEQPDEDAEVVEEDAEGVEEDAEVVEEDAEVVEEDAEVVEEDAEVVEEDAEVEAVEAVEEEAEIEDDEVLEIGDDEIDEDEISDDDISEDELGDADQDLPRFASEAPTANIPDPGFLASRAAETEPEPELDSEVPDTISEPAPETRSEPPPEGDEEPSPTPSSQRAADSSTAPEPQPEPEPEPELPLDPAPVAVAAEIRSDARAALPSELELKSAPQPQPEPELPPPSVQTEPFVAGVSLAEIKGFEDFPPETQLQLAKVARVERLATEEEVSGFGLALVLRGAVSVMPTVADVTCGSASERELIYGRGTLPDGVALRLVATAPDTQVAIWDFETIEPALAACPWVLEELQGVADRYQALAGVSMGPMGDRLDDSLRGMVLSRCRMVKLLPGEVLVEKGKPVGGLYIVGAGRLELGKDAASAGSEGQLGPGDFLFTQQILAGGAAPTSARAGSAGALLMAADRHAAHELMLSVPPLLELLAG
jgi:hypothetical protein